MSFFPVSNRKPSHKELKNAKLKNPRLFVLSAPSGAGKTTLGERLLTELPHLVRSISMTTRTRRGGERDARDYFFVTKEAFERDIKRGAFLEYAKVFGHYYGTPRAFVFDNLRRGRDVLLTIDVQGAMKVRRSCRKQSVFIFILPPSLKALRERLLKRHTDTLPQVQKRLKTARKEMAYLKKYDYAIVNDDVQTAAKELRSIIRAERLKIS